MLFQTTNLSSPVPITLTQNGVYTEPNGLGYSPVTVNVSGGVSIAKAIIRAYYPSGSVCTCSKGSTSLQSDTSGKYLFCLPSSGTWTLTCGSVTSTVTVDEYAFENAYVGGLDALKARCKATNFVRLSDSVGDIALGTNDDGRYITRTSAEPVLISYVYPSNSYAGYCVLSNMDSFSYTHNDYGDLNNPTAISISGKTLYLFTMMYQGWHPNILKVTTDSVQDTFGYDTYLKNDGIGYGTGATELNSIIEEYANMIN